ncbi:MAG TPA: TIGR01777 family oxidoreductase [Flavisolibacter sp.]|jgi:hypothetical protein|nr:TIGR01777 family oxidoreductase [Flavisolibacter sp.]
MATILITGGTGMIGKALTRELLQRQHRVMILSREHRDDAGGVHYVQWNIEKQQLDREALSQADYIIHLAGANVAEKRWSDRRKKEIVDSRVESGRLLVKALSVVPNKVKAIVSSSAIGWYGPDPVLPNPNPFTEQDKAYPDFLGKTCTLWEQSITPVVEQGKRLVILRTGIVLSTEGGAFKEFYKPLRMGVAAVLGSGHQVVSWIHIEDLVRIYIRAIEDDSMEGVYNAVAPHPVSNRELITAMARVKKGPSLRIPVPALALRLGLGEMSVEVLKSATVSSKKLERQGFSFSYPTIHEAVEQLIP